MGGADAFSHRLPMVIGGLRSTAPWPAAARKGAIHCSKDFAALEFAVMGGTFTAKAQRSRRIAEPGFVFGWGYGRMNSGK